MEKIVITIIQVFAPKTIEIIKNLFYRTLAKVFRGLIRSFVIFGGWRSLSTKNLVKTEPKVFYDRVKV